MDCGEADSVFCDICADSTGPLMQRCRPAYYAGTPLDPKRFGSRYQQAHVLDDGWVLLWEDEHRTSPSVILCPDHASGRRPPRQPAVAKVGNVSVDLKEFDYVGARGSDIMMFKHTGTRRYLNLRVTCNVVVAGELQNGSWVEYSVAEGFRRARSTDE